MRAYKCLTQQVFELDQYWLVPIRDEDKHAIRQWRNEQLQILRQKEPLTEAQQEKYFEQTVDRLFEQDTPSQILWSFLENGILVGYGGLVHIDWESKNAEISFLTQTERNESVKQFGKDWRIYLGLLKKAAFGILSFKKIYTYAYDIRPYLYDILYASNFEQEAHLRNHICIEGIYYDIRIHSCFNTQPLTFRSATMDDLEVIFKWSNDTETRQNSFTSTPISYQEHVSWFNQKVQDKATTMLIFEDNAQNRVGLVRIENRSQPVIGINVAPLARGKGYASTMILEACHFYFDTFEVKEIYAYIKNENKASIKAFKKAGFEQIESLIYAGFDTVLMKKQR